MSTNFIIKQIRKHEEALRKEHQVKALFIFGSFARGEASTRSDIDVLVDFSSQEIGMFEFVKLKNFLEQILKRNVDLVTRDALKDWIKVEFERDAIRAA